MQSEPIFYNVMDTESAAFLVLFIFSILLDYIDMFISYFALI